MNVMMVTGLGRKITECTAANERGLERNLYVIRLQVKVWSCVVVQKNIELSDSYFNF